MKIVIADKMESSVVAKISTLGNVIITPENLTLALQDAHVLIVRSATKVDEKILSFSPDLKIVARAGVGTDNIDIPACQKRGIKVINTPGASSNAVAEHALGLMFAAARKISYADNGMKTKKWLKKELLGTELQGKTLGIIGLGKIGYLLSNKALALGMKVMYFDKKDHAQPNIEFATLEKIFTCSDFVSLHIPLNDETKEIINSGTLSKMKPTSFLINTARGGLINEDDLYTALKNNQISGAGLDVYPVEPYSGKLCELSRVVCTPHIAGNTIEAQARIGDELFEKLKEEFAKIGD